MNSSGIPYLNSVIFIIPLMTKPKKRLMQMGELEDTIFTIGSPDVDVMFSDALPHLDEVKQYYEIVFDSYSVAMFHPVTTEADTLLSKANDFADALIASNKDYVVILSKQ